MNWFKKQYEAYKNGVIFTLIFHIVVLLFLNISQFKVKKTFEETELLIDFPEIEQQIETPSATESELQDNLSNRQRTNMASNRAMENKQPFDENLQREIEAAKNLAENVTKQLSKDIPTVNDLVMPEENTEGMDPDSILNKLYDGESNVEYFLENRYHRRLPIPVYLTQFGGEVTVSIIVDRSGAVLKAEPQTDGNATELQLSYAKTAAERTVFNADPEAPRRQNGYISYTFMAQN